MTNCRRSGIRTCDFDGSGSSDGDGTIESHVWDFGDDSSGSGAAVSHAYTGAGTYTVKLTVTDDAGATDTYSEDVTVSDDTSGIALAAAGYKVKGLQKADLDWSGAALSNVDIYRDGALIATTANDRFYTDNIDRRGGGSYTYKICKEGMTTCSNEVIVAF